MTKPSISESLAKSVAITMLAAIPIEAGAGEEWEFALSPLFLWGLSIDGDTTVNGRTTSLDLDFRDDILETMEAAFSVHFEARRGDWTFFTEYQYVDRGDDVTANRGPLQLKADTGVKDTMWELGATWAMRDDGRTRWELIGGGRYSDQELDVKFDIDVPLPPELPSRKLEAGDDWWHAFGGVRVFQEINDNWTFIARGDYGYGGSDNSAWNFSFLFDFRFREWGSAFIGGRYLDYDYEDRDFGFDAAKAGPVAGLTIYW
jgi:hypothetical protein